MKVLKKLTQQDFPKPTHTPQRQRPIGLTKWLFVALFFCTTCTLQGQWVFHIDCPCDMYPSISVSEHSGLKEHDRLICRGDVVKITATGGHKYLWSTGDTTNVITVDQAGGYGVTISDVDGCQAVENVLITEYSRPYLDYKDSFCSGYAPIKVKGTGIESVVWNDGSTKSYLNITESGTYSATIRDEYNCTYVESATITKGTFSTVDILVKNNLGHQVDHTICKGELIDLHASSGFTHYQWSASDGTVNSTGPTLFVEPTTTTTYMVVATDANGCTVTKSITIIVNELVASISSDQTICKGTSAQLLATGGTHYTWSPTVGLSDPTIGNPVASPTVTTTYSVTIKNSKGCKVIKKVTVHVTEANTTVGGAVSICLGESATLSATGGVSYAWSPSTSLNNANLAAPTATPSATTTYTVLITDANGCTATQSQTVIVNSVNVTIQGETTLCASDTINLEAIATSNNVNSFFTYVWNVVANSNHVVLTPPSTGTFIVTVTDTITSCTAVDSILVTVNDLQVEAGPDIQVCLGDSVQLQPLYTLNGTVIVNGAVSYAWSPSTGINDATIASPRLFPDSTTIYTVTITDGNGCTAIDSILISVSDLQVELGANQIICLGDSLQLSPQVSLNGIAQPDSNFTFSWSPTTDINNVAIANATISPTTTTTYTLTVIDVNGCIAIDSIQVTVNDLQVNMASDQRICLGDNVQLTPTYTLNGNAIVGTDTSFTYSWNPATEIDDPTTANPIVSPLTTTLYTVTITDEDNCTAVDSVLVTVTDLQVDAGTNQAICPGDSILLNPSLTINGSVITGSGSVAYNWSPTAGIDDSTSFTPIVFPESSTTYILSVVDSNGCTAVDSILVEVFPKIGPRLGTIPTRINYFESLSFIYQQSSSVPIEQFIWSPADYLNCPNDPTLNCSEPVFTDELAVDSTYILTLTVVDTNGCTDVEIVDVDVALDNSPPSSSMASLSGRIFTESGSEVANTTISLTGYAMPPEVTGTTGSYEFAEVPMHDHYLVTPTKDLHPLNGVSTFDLILISKHILGIQPFKSPYQLIAADVNRSGSITVFDIVELRKLLLRTKDKFSNNTSWRFVDANYEFKDLTNPFREDFPENYPIQDLESDMTWLDFIAVKIGDVNNSVASNSLVQTESRNTRGSLNLRATEELIDDGETIIYHFSSSDEQSILGYQFTLEFDPTQLVFDRVMTTSIVGDEYFGFSQTQDGIITSSWNQEAAIDFSKESSMFSLAFKRKDKEVGNDRLVINSNNLQAEAYTDAGKVLDIQLVDQLVVPEVALDKIELYQNRPNPFTGMTTIGFDLPKATTATLRIFDATGKVIKVYEEAFDNGYNELIIKSKDLTEYGALYYQLATPTQIATKKMIHTH